MNNRISELIKGVLVLILTMSVAIFQADQIVEKIDNGTSQSERITDLSFSQSQLPLFQGNVRIADGIVREIRPSIDFLKLFIHPEHHFELVLAEFNTLSQHRDYSGFANCLPPGRSLHIIHRQMQV